MSPSFLRSFNRVAEEHGLKKYEHRIKNMYEVFHWAVFSIDNHMSSAKMVETDQYEREAKKIWLREWIPQ